MQRLRKATSCGEQTAERRHEQPTATATALVASRFHTVTTSEPAAPTRIVGVRPRTGIVLGMPLRRQDAGEHVARQTAMRSIDKTRKSYQSSYRSHSVSLQSHSSSIDDRESDLEWESDADDETVERTQTRVSHRSNSSIPLQEDVLSRIGTLKALCDEGFISPEDYERRKNAVMDEITFPSVARSGQYTITQTNQMPQSQGMPLIVPHAPDFRDIEPEVATKHVFDYETRQWSSMRVYVRLDETPFSKGSLRIVHHMQDLNAVESTGSYVAKLAIDPDEDPQTYFRDIELQAHCAYYAQLYNSYNPPKRVEFIHAWILELIERNGALCAVEPYIPGEYRKHNNNFGSVSEDERNTPQAFSHFTYEASNHEILAVDIQGVGDLYTDPQLHTLDGNDFGKGNLGVTGFHKFMSTHRCNSICRYLKLPQVNPKERQADYGTVPIQELMNRDRVRPTHFDSKHYYEHAPMLQKYITQCRDSEQKKRGKRRGRRERSTFGRICHILLCGCGRP